MIDQLNALCKDTFVSSLGIKFLDCGDDFIEASMPVNDKLQPMGYLHGGASLALAETVANGGSYLFIDNKECDAFGLQVSGSHISTIRSGTLYARAELIHKGKTTHVWDVKIKGDNNKLVSVSRVTIMIVKKNNG